MLAKLPGWVETDRFDIEATAPLHVTKDQYRLMTQALLAGRFGLKLHFEKESCRCSRWCWRSPEGRVRS